MTFLSYFEILHFRVVNAMAAFWATFGISLAIFILTLGHTVGRAVASDTRGPTRVRIQLSAIVILNVYLLLTVEKTKIKRPGLSHFLKMWPNRQKR